MFTDVDLLPVYNKLYDLNLSEEEIEKISTLVDKLDGTHFVYNFLANQTLVRLYPSTVSWKRRASVEMLPFDKETGGVKGYDGGRFENTYLTKHLPCYTIDRENEAFIIKNIEVLKLDKIDQNAINACVTILSTKNKEVPLIVDGDLNLLKKKCKEAFSNSFFYERHLRKDLEDLNVPEFLNWTFGTKLERTLQPQELRNQDLSYIFQIVEVSEHNNVRIVVAKRPNASYYSQWSATTYIIADEKQDCYNYLDIGRQFYRAPNKIADGYHTLSCDSSIKQFPKLFLLNKDVKAALEESVFTDIENRNIEKPVVLVDSITMETAIKQQERREEIATKKKNQKKKLVLKFKEKVDQLLKDGGKLSINGIKIEPHSIEYEGQKLVCSSISLYSIVNQFSRYRDIDSINFDSLSEAFFNGIGIEIERAHSGNTISGSIGDVSFIVENRVKKNVNGHTVRTVYINNYKVKKNEVGDILSRGLCFEKQEVFDDFIHQVSKCSLFLHKYLNEGIQLRVRDDYRNKNIKFKIPLVRKNNKNYIVLDNKEYGVSDSNKLIRLSSSLYMHDIINTLLNPKVVRIDGPDDIAFIIAKGEELHRADKDKNKKLIEHVENLFNLEISEIVVNGKRRRGYIIAGNMSQYFLDIGRTDKESFFDNLRVYSYPEMQYVCMIDKGVEQTGPSHLVNRIYALHNDSLIARDIKTLNQIN